MSLPHADVSWSVIVAFPGLTNLFLFIKIMYLPKIMICSVTDLDSLKESISCMFSLELTVSQSLY